MHVGGNIMSKDEQIEMSSPVDYSEEENLQSAADCESLNSGSSNCDKDNELKAPPNLDNIRTAGL